MNHYDEGFVCGHWSFDCELISFDASPLLLRSYFKRSLIPPNGISSDNFFKSKKTSYSKHNGIPIAGIIGGPGSGGPDRPF